MQEDQKIEEYVLPDDFEENKEINWKEKLIDFLNGIYFVPIVIILIAIISFSLGRISGLQEKREPVRVISENMGEVKGMTTEIQPLQNTTEGQVVASKNGTKYHYPWCAGAKQIAEKNLITFDSIEKARAAGYTPAANCKGLK